MSRYPALVVATSWCVALAATVVLAPFQPNLGIAAVGLGAVVAARQAGPEAVIEVFPADPFIGDEHAFDRHARAGVAAVA